MNDTPSIAPRHRQGHVQSHWDVLDDVRLTDVFDERRTVLQSCSVHLRGRFRHAARIALEARSVAVLSNDRVMETRAWNLFCLIPCMLLRRSLGENRVGKAELNARFDRFQEGRWDELLREVQRNSPHTNNHVKPMTVESRARAACQKVRLGEVSRARQCLTGPETPSRRCRANVHRQSGDHFQRRP